MSELADPSWFHPQFGRRVASYKSLDGIFTKLFMRALQRPIPTIEVFERGARLVSGGRLEEADEIAFDAIESVRFRVTNVRRAGCSQGEVTLHSKLGTEIFWRALLRLDDSRFVEVRNALCAPLAHALCARVLADGRAPWVPGVWLATDRIDVDAAIAPGRTRRYSIPFRELEVDMQPRSCAVRSKSDPERVLVVEHKDSNFFPGLLALERLRADAQGRELAPES
jgi:hypothetical protein